MCGFLVYLNTTHTKMECVHYDLTMHADCRTALDRYNNRGHIENSLFPYTNKPTRRHFCTCSMFPMNIDIAIYTTTKSSLVWWRHENYLMTSQHKCLYSIPQFGSEILVGGIQLYFLNTVSFFMSQELDVIMSLLSQTIYIWRLCMRVIHACN